MYFEIQSEGLNQGSQREKDERSIASQLVEKTKKNKIFKSSFLPVFGQYLARKWLKTRPATLWAYWINMRFYQYFDLSFSLSLFQLRLPFMFQFGFVSRFITFLFLGIVADGLKGVTLFFVCKAIRIGQNFQNEVEFAAYQLLV